MKKQSNTIDKYYSKIPCPAPPQAHSNRKENIYEAAMKRKFSNVSVEAPVNRRTLLPPNSMCMIEDNKDQIIKRQKLEIEELQAKQAKFKKTQTEMLKMLHDYRLRLLRTEKSSAQITKQLQPAALDLLFEDEITEEQMREFFADSELVQLNSISKLKSNTHESCSNASIVTIWSLSTHVHSAPNRNRVRHLSLRRRCKW